MRKRKFVVLSMGLVADIDAPIAHTHEVLVERVDENGENAMLHIPVYIQSFSNREQFVQKMSEMAGQMWDMQEQAMQNNEKIEMAERVLSGKISTDIKDLN